MMMLSNKELHEKWNNMPVFGGGYIRIDSTHPVEIYIGYEELNQKTLLILSGINYENIPSSKSIIANNFQRPKGDWAQSFKLIRKDNEDVFIRLCWDIIESSRTHDNDTIKFIIDRYMKWHKLMEHQRPDVMDISRQKGLIGELMFLEECLKKFTASQALYGWGGPEGADQDFTYDNCWTEVKAASLASESISISSLEQLDADLPGNISVFFLDKTTPEDINGFSLAQKVNDIRLILSSESEAKEIFENKLFAYGYKDRREYSEQKYRLGGRNNYVVSEDFPRLIKNNVPFQIVSSKYSISISAIEDFMI